MKKTANNTIYSYQLKSPLAQFEIFEMPEGAEIIDFGLNEIQGGVPTFWASVEPTRASEPRVFCRFDTGEEIPEDHNPEDMTLIGRCLGASKSKSQPGQATLRNTFWFECYLKTKQIYLDKQAAMEALKDDEAA